MIVLPYLTLVRVTGEDAGAFLQAQLAADVAALAPGEAEFAALCSARGQVVGLLLVHRRGEDWLICGAATLMDAIVDRLRRFVLRSRVHLEPEPARLAGLPDGTPRPADSPIVLRSTPLRYTLASPEQRGHGDPEDWRGRELRHGVIWLDPATSERFIPQMLGLDRIGAVSFQKGCYPGQEIIARARYLGQVKRGPVWVTVAAGTAVSPGTDCVLQTTDAAAEAVVAGVARYGIGNTLVVAVAALPDDAAVRAIVIEGSAMPAERLAPPA